MAPIKQIQSLKKTSVAMNTKVKILLLYLKTPERVLTLYTKKSRKKKILKNHKLYYLISYVQGQYSLWEKNLWHCIHRNLFSSLAYICM